MVAAEAKLAFHPVEFQAYNTDLRILQCQKRKKKQNEYTKNNNLKGISCKLDHTIKCKYILYIQDERKKITKIQK